jgi:hypothetical protein
VLGQIGAGCYVSRLFRSEQQSAVQRFRAWRMAEVNKVVTRGDPSWGSTTRRAAAAVISIALAD